jgi:hypothetical protein
MAKSVVQSRLVEDGQSWDGSQDPNLVWVTHLDVPPSFPGAVSAPADLDTSRPTLLDEVDASLPVTLRLMPRSDGFAPCMCIRLRAVKGTVLFAVLEV